MSSPMLVTGGTGTLGCHVVSRLRDAGHHIRVVRQFPGAKRISRALTAWCACCQRHAFLKIIQKFFAFAQICVRFLATSGKLFPRHE
jgi:nucleoside-diphosphate-sugar epimerase